MIEFMTMRRKIATICVLILVGVLVILGLQSKGGVETAEPVAPSPTPPSLKKVNFGNTDYAYEAIRVESGAGLELIPNFKERLGTEEIIERHKCKEAVSGGFYGEDNKPLGLFMVGERKLGGPRESQLFNGFVWADEGDVIGVGYERPEGKVRFILQTGPVVFDNGEKSELELFGDKMARRVMVGVTGEKRAVFLAVFDPETAVLGPRLVDLPGIVESLNETQKLDLVNVVNLDGGRASAFYASGLTLREVTPVGSLFCVRGD